jgi:transcriptional regulator NrdR family protein
LSLLTARPVKKRRAWRQPRKRVFIMNTITKRSGKEESFQTDKILNSMRNAGISLETAEKVANAIEHHPEISTSEVRNRVIGGIKNREPQAAKQYESHPRKTH